MPVPSNSGPSPRPSPRSAKAVQMEPESLDYGGK